jgi:UDP-N-acetylglucosamine--N-acetylmuramyl-(pentapeptide) pyrophosphoryl-undecaprenol N-acetylglucosamine transferase
VFTAWLRRIPTAICEQNSIPGLTNKLLGRVARSVFLSFDESRRFFKPKKTVMSGNPVRRGIVQKLLSAPSDQSAVVHVLVSGGSQGAVAVNDLASQALIALAQDHSLAIVHQTGEKDLEATAARYREAGVAAECHAFIKDMASAYQRADLIVGRAGATTVAELAIAAKPAVLIPYPFAADNHQELNARSLADAGAAVMILEPDLSPEKLAANIRELYLDREKLSRMEKAAGNLGRPEAAKEIADVCVELVERRWGSLRGRTIRAQQAK